MYHIKLGFYYSAGCNGYYDINDHEIVGQYQTEKYREYVKHVEAQVKELWTRYGELFEIWFDGGIVPVEDGGPNIKPLLGMDISTDGDFKDEEQFRTYRSNCVGHKRIIPLEPFGINDAGAITFRVTESAGEAKLRDVGIY